MFVIIDENDVVQDIASEQENLSRGYNVPGKITVLEIDSVDVRIGDFYRGGKLIINEQLRQQQAEKAANRQKVDIEIRRFAIEALKQKGEIPPEYTE